MPYIFTIATVIFIAAGQLLFKKSASVMAEGPLIETVRDTRFLIPFFSALCIYGLSVILWILALRDLPLSRAYVFMAISFVIVPICSALLLSEKITPAYMVGVGFIVTGIIVTQAFE